MKHDLIYSSIQSALVCFILTESGHSISPEASYIY